MFPLSDYHNTRNSCHCIWKTKVAFHLSVLSGRPKRTGSGQFKRKGLRNTRKFFPDTTLQIPALWPTEAVELSGSYSFAGPFWLEPVLRTRAFNFSKNWSEPTNGKRLNLTNSEVARVKIPSVQCKDKKK